MISRKWLLWTLVFIFAAAVITAGCGGSNTAQKPAQPDAAKLVTITTSNQPCVHALPNYMAMKKGWDKAEGLKIEYQFYPSGPPQNEALASNKWEVGDMGAVPGMLACLRYNAYIIAISNDESITNDLWVRPNSPILQKKGVDPKYPNIYGSPADWKGKTILLTTASTGHYAVIATLKALGLSEKDVKMVHMEQSQAMAAFEAGQGDIVQLWAPFDYIGESKGWKKVSSGQAAGVMIPGVIVASKKAVDESPEKVAKWLKLYMRGLAEMKANPKESAAILDAYYKEHGITLTESALMQEFTLRPTFNTQEQLALFKKDGSAPSKVDVWMSDLAEFFVQQGRITPEEKAQLLKGNHMTDKIMKMVAEQEAKK